MFSRRVRANLPLSPFYDSFSRALNEAYHPTQNPNGIISLGIAENTLMRAELSEFLNENIVVDADLLGYGAIIPRPSGLTQGLIALYNSDPFNPFIPVTKGDIYCTGGCTVLLEQLFWILCDDGDGVLIGRPLYGGFLNDLNTKGKVELIPVSLEPYDPFSEEAVCRYEEEYYKAVARGINIRALVLCTPHNPLGR